MNINTNVFIAVAHRTANLNLFLRMKIDKNGEDNFLCTRIANKTPNPIENTRMNKKNVDNL